jgi:glycosyltransferase involved in cell wall biosynthesis
MTARLRVSIVVFEINEIDGMRAMMPQISPDWYDELIIVDGGSTDGTIEYARSQGYDIFVQQAKGVGGALSEAVARATGDIVVLYAPDGSFLTDRIPMMIQKINEGYDIVNVTRYGFGASSADDTFWTGSGNQVFTLLVNLFFGRRFWFTDFLYTYVAFRRELVKEMKVETHLITWTQILMLRSIVAGKKIVEIPGDEPKRIGGDVKVAKIKTAWIIFTTILREWWNAR